MLPILLSACATSPRSSTRVAIPEQPQVCPFGSIALVDQSSAGDFSYQKGKGKLGTVGEAILDSAELGLSAPVAGVIVTGKVLSWETFQADSGNGAIFYTALAGAAGGVTTVGMALAGPVVGAEGLIRSLKSVSPAELAEREAALSRALSQMAEPKPFHDALLQIAAQRIQGGLRSFEQGNSSEVDETPSVDAVLETHIDQVSLQRSGSGEASFFLRIKTHARLTRKSDGAICLEERAEYRSGTCLFLDWTYEGAIEGVAETGYRTLARYYINRLLHGSQKQGEH